MGSKTAIEWTDSSWNPVTGCTKVSPGCDNCYAERLSKRFGWPWSVQTHEDRLDIPRHWRKPRRVFVCSMGDLFHEDVPPRFSYKVLDTIWANPQHIFQVLTKRPERFPAVFELWQDLCLSVPIHCRYVLPHNLWLGVTAENQEEADRRIPLLLQMPAAVRFVSVEPMLEPVDLRRYMQACGCGGLCDSGEPCPMAYNAIRLDWCIVGGETGPGARPMHIDWARSLRNQCIAASVPFFFKSWGSPLLRKNTAPAMLDGRVWREFPRVNE